jgi:hypothetical protein
VRNEPKEQYVLKFTFCQPKSWGALSLGVIAAGVLFQTTSTSWASIPKSRLPAPHTMTAKDELLKEQRLSQQMTELSMKHEGAPDFDSDLAQLSSRERQYRERLPGLSGHPRLKSVVSRVAGQPYKPLRR